MKYLNYNPDNKHYNTNQIEDNIKDELNNKVAEIYTKTLLESYNKSDNLYIADSNFIIDALFMKAFIKVKLLGKYYTSDVTIFKDEIKRGYSKYNIFNFLDKELEYYNINKYSTIIDAAYKIEYTFGKPSRTDLPDSELYKDIKEFTNDVIEDYKSIKKLLVLE